jgi:hypothetical protein
MAWARTSLTARRYVARLIGHREPSATIRRASVDVFSAVSLQELQEMDLQDD